MTALQVLIVWFSVVGIFHGVKPVPDGVNYASDVYAVADSSMELLTDLTFTDSTGETRHEQEIWDSIFTYIDSAERYILLDMFLFNSYKGPADWSLNELSADLCQLLVDKVNDNPEIKIDFITDPVNTLYGGIFHTELEMMSAAGINVIVTDLNKLRDSNPFYSPIWRTFIQWFGNSHKYGIFPNPYSSKHDPVTFRSYLAFLNLKANHRKVFVADHGQEMISIVTSSNPHSASADFSNIGLIVRGDIWKDIYRTEAGVASMSGSQLSGDFLLESSGDDQVSIEENSIQLITERKIKEALIHHIDATRSGDSVKIAMFYLSNRQIIKTLLNASDRGVSIRLLLDPNLHGFGLPHNGTPNQPVARELKRKSNGKISIRWYRTQGEQFHTKLSIINREDQPLIAILGSANLTRKNINGFNLETDVLLKLEPASAMAQEIEAYFSNLWNNVDQEYTMDHDTLAPQSWMKTLLYRFQEGTGISTY